MSDPRRHDPAPPLPPERTLTQDPRLPWMMVALYTLMPTLFLFMRVGDIIAASTGRNVLSRAENLVMIVPWVVVFALEAWTVLILKRAGVRIGRSRFSSMPSRSERDVPKELGRFIQPGELVRVVMPEAGRRGTMISSALVVTDRRVLLLNCVPFTNEAYELAWETQLTEVRLGSTKSGRLGDRVELITPNRTRRLSFRKRYSAAARIREAFPNA
jgi:hypothetical protein